MSDERLAHLEARYLWLERHVAGQDKAMADMGDEIRKLRREMESFRERIRVSDAAGGAEEPEEPPPPHY